VQTGRYDLLPFFEEPRIHMRTRTWTTLGVRWLLVCPIGVCQIVVDHFGFGQLALNHLSTGKAFRLTIEQSWMAPGTELVGKYEMGCSSGGLEKRSIHQSKETHIWRDISTSRSSWVTPRHVQSSRPSARFKNFLV